MNQAISLLETVGEGRENTIGVDIQQQKPDTHASARILLRLGVGVSTTTTEGVIVKAVRQRN